MSEQRTPVSITIESITFEKMLEKDICNTKWTMARLGTQHKEDATVVFNSDYTISGKDFPLLLNKWRYVGPNQIDVVDAQSSIIFFNTGHLIMLIGMNVGYIGERVF